MKKTIDNTMAARPIGFDSKTQLAHFSSLSITVPREITSTRGYTKVGLITFVDRDHSHFTHNPRLTIKIFQRTGTLIFSYNEHLYTVAGPNNCTIYRKADELFKKTVAPEYKPMSYYMGNVGKC